MEDIFKLLDIEEELRRNGFTAYVYGEEGECHLTVRLRKKEVKFPNGSRDFSFILLTIKDGDIRMHVDIGGVYTFDNLEDFKKFGEEIVKLCEILKKYKI